MNDNRFFTGLTIGLLLVAPFWILLFWMVTR